MKWIFLFIGCLTISLVQAQGEFLNKSNSIAPIGSGMNITAEKKTAPSVFTPKVKLPEATKSKSILEDKRAQFMNMNDFANPGDPLKSRLNKSDTAYNPNYVNKNMDFGMYKTKSEFVTICYRDFSAPDGDMVRIFTQDMMLVPMAILDNECKYMKLNLIKGANIINFEALNEGSSYPNTGELQIFDETGKVITSNQWGLESGYKGVVTIYKE